MKPHLWTLLQCAFTVLALMCNSLTAQVHHLRLSVQEGLPTSTVVGDLRAALPSGAGLHGFFISESRDSDVFRDLEIDSDSGIISTATLLDRERRDKYEFAAATLTGEVIKVTVVVKDVNDHWPTFPVEVFELNVSELSLPGSHFELPGALDMDEGLFGTQGYRVLKGGAEELFKVELRNGGGGTILNFDLVLMEKLDREGQDLYSLTVEAFDGGVPPKTGHLQVHVNVLDENDNPPVFNQTEYEAVLWENAPLLTSVCQVYATDPDLGNNGLVTYEIVRRQSDPNEFFIVDKNTGVIRLNKPLDYESQTFFELVVTAKDHGAQPESSNTFVGIKILDVNDNSPNINVLFLSETGDPEVSEGAGYGDYVARIAISDPDLGEIKKVSVFLEGGDKKFTLKATDEFLYALCVDGPLDREQKDLYELTIVASDFGSPPLRSERTFLLQVTDVNDNPPTFEKKAYEVSVTEDLPIGDSILQVKAHDRDEDSGIFYSILRSNQDYLVNIDPQTGIISIAAGLDRESDSDLTFLVVAVDGGFPPLTSTATVSIHVEDINDNKPVFSQQLYNATIQEHLAIGTCFLQVIAEDADGGEFGMVRYSFSDGYNSEDSHPLFHINPVTGDICVYEDIDCDGGLVTIDLLIKAEDQGGLWSQAYLHIDVEDVNDNAPVFNPEKYITSISSHTQPRAEILTVIATDQDSGHYGQITYELLPGDSSSLFSVDQSTGTVSLSSPLSALGSSSVRLTVSAHDGQGVPAVQPADIIINVLHTDLTPALFHNSHYTFFVPEDVPPGTAVGTVQAIKPPNSVEALSYRISSGDPLGLFSVDSQSGVISTSLALDHESLHHALLTLQALTGTLPIYSSTQVNITITDVNDNPPVFPKTSDFITISHNTLPGTILFLAHAHDADSGANGRIHYSLRPQSEIFSIHPQLGMLTLNSDILRDANRRYKLSVVAEDEGSPPLSSLLSLVVELDSSAPGEETLAFETLIYQVEIGESAQRDTRVIQVRAHASKTRRGSDLAQALKYSLEPLSRPPPFLLHPDTGWLFVAQSLDYESEPTYRFNVRAMAQNGAANLTATAMVLVMVQDENDNTPVFSRDRFFFNVPEGPTPHGLIGMVKATDRDSKKNGQLSYILLSDGKHFRINSKTGELINWVALDREEHSHHTLRVLVTDHGNPRLNATTTVHILVCDVNDNPPEFTHLPANKELNVQVWSGLPVGSVVTSMFAKDRDAGQNATVTFSLISGGGNSHFKIDPQSGDIKVTAGFIPNPYTNYTLTVVAKDNGPKPLEQSAVVHIQVHASQKHNDVLGLRQFTVKENVKLGTVIGLLQMSGTFNKQLRYSVAEGDGSLHFGVDSASGALYVAQPLDYEATQRYFFIIRAEALPTVNASVLVAVSVEDVNDHAPWFPGDDSVVVFGVQEDVAIGTAVYTFNARDGDGSLRNSAIHYSMTFDPDSSIEKPPFHIDPHTGVVTTTAKLNRERIQSFAFTVTARDQAEQPSHQRCASVTAQVFLQDVNDNSPTFVSMETVHVAEDAEVGRLLFHLLATDIDEGENGYVTYSLIDGNKGRHFRLERTGHLYLNSSLNYESQPVFKLTVRASDSGLPSLSSTQTLTVVVLDVNDEAPMFERRVYVASAMENREPGQPVVRVTAVDLDSEENAIVSYSLLPGLGYEFFTIDSHTGLVSTSTQLDREAHQSFTLRVQAEDSGINPLSSTATILCTVLDENDNPPEFSQPSFHLVIPENLPPGVIHTSQASDPDNGVNGTVKYFIKNTDGHFSIDAVTGAISTVKALDREERSNYTLVLIACDQGPSPLTSTTLLSIFLSDENDNSPTFSRKSYRAFVSEGLHIGSEILWLNARDPDEGPNGEVSFSLAEDTFGTFSVDSASGVVTLTKPLDRETRSQHTFRAIATDNCSQGPRSSIAIVTVHVEDLNDNPPACSKEPTQILITTKGNPYVGQPITKVTADDPDYRENGTVVFSLEEEDELFQIDRSSGEVRLKASLAGDVSGSRVLSVLAADQGTPALTSSCLVLVQLNGEKPLLQFTEKVYEVTLPENSKTGSWVANVVAHDPTAPRTIVKYSIFNGNENGAFSISPSTGDITVREQNLLDFETERKIHLVVLAENGHQSAYARVTITLQDVNDNAPVFKQSYYRTAVWEGQIHNTYVMQVLAMDYDSGLNGQIDYSIVDGNHNNAFIIDSVRGILATNTVLDREIISSYRLVLEAKDWGSPPLTGTCTVRVQIVDVNDNSPAIPPMEPLVVSENLPPGHIVTQIMANDVDLNSTIIYSLAGKGEENRSFAIDRYSGVITSTRILDYEEQVLHTLRIVASDSVHQTEAEVTIQVLDVNDNAPTFSQEFYQVKLPELTSANSFVVAVSATDKDSGLNGRISYRLLSSPMKGFYIHAENGSIYTTKPLKYVTSGNVIRLLVEAQDNGDPSLSSITSVDIQVEDSNDHAPYFQNNTYQVSIGEDAPVGSVLLSLLAEDQDYSDENTHLDYSITAGNEQRRFCIEVITVPTEAQQRTVGYLTLCDNLDREITDTYSLTVTVMDRGVPPLNSSATVSVTVLDVNDHEPVFNSSEYYAQVSENSLVGTVLVQVFTQDLDLGPNGTVRYDLISGNSKGLFRLDPETGSLEVNGTLDYEEDTKHILTVQASDGGCPGDRKVSFAVIFITVLDENDNSPFFMFSTINCSVAENLPAFTPVCMVHAVDQDAGTFGLLTYSILTSCFMDYGSGNPDRKEAFAIDPLTGDIQTRQTFDYERDSEYCFLVEARDKGDQAATVRVQVDIEGMDEFSPIFTQKVYQFTLPDNAKVGQSVGHVMAMDHDGGLDGIVQYSLVNPSPFFNINRTTGSVYISNPVYRRKGPVSSEDVEDLTVLASSPKLDSRSTACRVIVNISNSAEALTGIALSVQTVSLTVSLTVFLLLLISFVALVLRYKTKENALKKAASLAANLNNGTGTFGRLGSYPHNGISAINLQDLHAPLDMRAKRDISNPLRNSGSSGRGSAEGETAEDQEIKMINEYQHIRQPGSVMPEPDSGIPIDSDQVSCHSVDTHPATGANLGVGHMVEMASAESLHNFKEEGGGEGMLPRVVNMREMEEVMKGCMPLPDHQDFIEGSLTNLICPEEQLRGSYGWDHLLNWEPRFQPLASVFTDIGMLPDEEANDRPVGAEFHSLLRPPPLITGVAQPGIRAVPPRMPQRMVSLAKKPSYPKYAYSPLARNTGLTPSAMTPSFSPSLSLLTLRTPNASPVVSETGLGNFTKMAPLPGDVLGDAEIKV